MVWRFNCSDSFNDRDFGSNSCEMEWLVCDGGGWQGEKFIEAFGRRQQTGRRNSVHEVEIGRDGKSGRV
ncbi:hypothetical protein SLEP1_g56120 [Rubroshorea leprosula]|uniref:Uncharacterized protein n=1 Tax=Rubroshorea leprosula TaxID=152421 RepID=A0AAV5MIM8_9ROSI|nr:hypothetical protein SLEP1_g56120 [Rubroshorea leprosula]